MKKSLIALAALAATASFAQSSVTLSGNLDFAYGNVKADGQAAENTVSSSTVASTTSVINIIAVEDLGGGMKATAKFGIDPRALANDNNAGATAASSTGVQAPAPALGVNNTFNRDELFVGLQGGFGNLRLGSPNSIGLTTFLVGSPLGTGVGSGYLTNAFVTSNIRYDRSVRYDSPSFGGLTVSVLHAPGADAAVGTSIPASGSTNELGLSYANGPLSVAYANISQPRYLTSVKTSSNMLAVSYKIDNTTLSAGWNDGDSKTRATTTTDSKGYRVGVRQDMGAIALLASYAEQEHGTATRKVTGLRGDYSLSKTAAVYLGYEKYDSGATTNPMRTIVSAGVRKVF